MSATAWIQILGVAVPLAVAITGGLWALIRFRRTSPYSSERARRYEEAYREICIGTIPRMSSYDWRENELPTVYRDLIRKAENRDSRYASATLEEDVAWINKKIVHGEAILNKNRLYIDKKDRDLFRKYLVSAKAYADSGAQDAQVLDSLFKLRNELTKLTQPILKRVYK